MLPAISETNIQRTTETLTRLAVHPRRGGLRFGDARPACDTWATTAGLAPPMAEAISARVCNLTPSAAMNCSWEAEGFHWLLIRTSNGIDHNLPG
jgi:hypothetical protein